MCVCTSLNNNNLYNYVSKALRFIFCLNCKIEFIKIKFPNNKISCNFLSKNTWTYIWINYIAEFIKIALLHKTISCNLI